MNSAFSNTRDGRRPFFCVIMATALLLGLLYGFLLILWGQRPVILELPWFVIMIYGWWGLSAFSVAYLALMRYRVVRDAASYWLSIAFSGSFITIIFYILAWPGLLPGEQAIAVSLPGTAAWFATLFLIILGVALLVSGLVRWPGGTALAGPRWLWSELAWMTLITVINILIIVFEFKLPEPIAHGETFAPFYLILTSCNMILFAAGAVISTRRYLKHGDALHAYTALTQTIMAFTLVMIVTGGKRYDLWWYLARFFVTGGFMVMMFSLLSDYARLYRRERDRAEELDALFEAVPMAVFISRDPDCLHMTGNRLADEILRISHGNELSLSGPAETKPSNFRPLKDGRELRLDELPAQRAARGEHVKDFEITLAFNDGMVRHVLGYGTPLLDNQGSPRGSVAVLVDITERKRAEEVLQTTLQRFYVVLSSMYTAVLLVTDEGRTEFANQAFRDYFGLKDAPADLMGLDSRDMLEKIKNGYLRPDEAAVRIREILDRRQPVKGEEIAMHDGRTCLRDFIPLNIYGKSYGRLWLHFDITERKQAEEARKQLLRNIDEQRGRLQAIIDSLPIGLWIADSAGKMILVNDFARKLWGGEAPKAESTKEYGVYKAWWADTGKPIVAEDMPLARSLKGETCKDLEIDFERFDGTRGTQLVSSTPIKASDGTVIGSVAVVQDITERKRVEENILRLNENLKRQNTELASVNKELDAFSYAVSHDLRAPLRHIDGFIHILSEDYADKLDEIGKDHIRRVVAGAEKMKNLIDALLGLARFTRGELNRTKVYLSTLAKMAADELAKTQPMRRVVFVIADDVTAMGDQIMIRAVLDNLIGNAWKFTEKRPVAKIEFGVTQLDGKDVYFVKDNGAGFDMKFSEKLYMPFQRLHTESEFPGLGIGLTIVQRIVHRHGGRVWAEAEADQGATFYFTLR